MLLREPLTSRLREKGKIPWKRLDELLKESEGDCSRFCSLAIRDGYLDRDSAGKIVGDVLGFAYVGLLTTVLQADVITRLPRNLARKYFAVPMYKLGATVTVAMYHPHDQAAVLAIENVLGCSIDPVFSFADEIESAIQQSPEAVDLSSSSCAVLDLDSFMQLGESKLVELKPVAALCDSIIMTALKEGASDIHIEPREHYAVVRFRVDGLLRGRARIPGGLIRKVVARYKILASLDITDSRIPHDGRISFQTPQRKIDVRVSTLPLVHGEKIVMRLLGSLSDEIKLNLEKLAISEDILEKLRRMLDEPNGIVFVTGPTGSGKSTTLYASLNYADSPESNLTTIEDPVEYEVSTLNQSAVDVKAGRTFQAILRAILRQDPDVILVGEIRDTETARIATQAALTGHLVLSSLHTNSSLQAMTRLLDMGIEPYVVAPAVLGVIGQRLVRRLCRKCRRSYEPERELMEKYFYWEGDYPSPLLYKAVGCPECKETGFRGRVGIHEIFQVTSEVREHILTGKTYNDIRALAYASGFQDMRFDGFRKAFEGLTTLEEILRVTASEA